MPDPNRLGFVYDGWDGYNRSVVAAVAPLTTEQLAFKGSPEMRSVGEVAWHIGDGRVDWFSRMQAPLSEGLHAEMHSRPSQTSQPSSAEPVVDWLNRTWAMIQATLDQWTVADMAEGYCHSYQGKTYLVSRQWTIWRILCNDIHHGGQLSELLAMQGIFPMDLTYLGGHLTEPPLAEPS